MPDNTHISSMQPFSRCSGCGAVNDADAAYCYLCGRSPLLHSCPRCDAPFHNPFDSRCRLCSARFVHSDAPDDEEPPMQGDSPDPVFGNHYLAHDSNRP